MLRWLCWHVEIKWRDVSSGVHNGDDDVSEQLIWELVVDHTVNTMAICDKFRCLTRDVSTIFLHKEREKEIFILYKELDTVRQFGKILIDLPASKKSISEMLGVKIFYS